MDGFCRVEQWFEEQGWEPFPFQREVWRAYMDGYSGLVHSPTGTGKTLSVWIGALIEALNPLPSGGEESDPKVAGERGLRVLWITPLRALAADTLASLQSPVKGLGLNWAVEARTGDTSASVRAKQAERMPEALVTTPESLSLMLTREDSEEIFENLQLVVVDEWHELMASKRGVQTELALARLRKLSPQVRTWGLSATLGNLEEALETLLGVPDQGRAERTTLVTGDIGKEIIIDSILPETIERFPWAGHFGMQMIPRVVEAIAEGGTCLVFCNTRSQTELWFQSILEARPDWAGQIAIHHGSLDRETRDQVELGLKEGRLRAVVCTSSLDLGVDFTPVDRVLQVGSPKGVARLLQRAGRSGHQPGVPSRVSCVPTHALDMVDIAAARDAANANRIESREGLPKPLDVLAQHLVTIALGPGFRSDELYEEVRTSRAYRDLTPEEWRWVIDFVTRGGSALTAYPEYSRVVLDNDVYRVKDKHIAHRHRMSIGTILADAAMNVQYLGGSRLGTIEESFLSRLNPGDKFIFAGKALQFVRIKDMTAYVKPAKSSAGAVPRWMGGRIALSGELAHAIREKLEEAKHGDFDSPEMQLLAPLLEVQDRWSAIPAVDEVLVERVQTREGHHLFIYPMEGRLVHEGLSALFAYRMSKLTPITFSMACNDYGIELLSPEPAPLDEALGYGLFSPENLLEDIPASLNAAEMARRQFREIARIAGLVFQGFPGANKSAKQLQASSGLFYDVFRRFDPENMLLIQANREVLERQLEQSRLAKALERLETSRILLTEPPRPTPLAFPILVDRLRGEVTSENVSDRIQKMSISLEREADKG